MAHKKKGIAECSNYRGIFLMVHAGQFIPKINFRNLNEYRGKKRVLLDEKCGFRPSRSTVDFTFDVHQQQKVYDSVDRTFLLSILKRCGVLLIMLSIIHQLDNDMQYLVRIISGEFSEWFAV